MARILFGEAFLEDNVVILSLINANSPLVWDSVDARRGAGLRASQPGHAHHALHPGRRDVARDRRRPSVRRRWPRRSPAWPSSSSYGPGAPVVLGSLCQLDLDAVGRAHLRHARAGPRPVRHGRARPSARGPVPLGRQPCAARRSPTPRRPTSRRPRSSRPILAGVNFVLHAAGWLEGGLAIGYEKFILDLDQCGMVGVFVEGIDLSENGQALDAIRENGPGHALPRQRPTRWPTSRPPSTAPRPPTTTPTSSGSRTAHWTPRSGRTVIWKRMLAEYEAPPIDPGVDEALLDFIARRKASFPDSDV